MRRAAAAEVLGALASTSFLTWLTVRSHGSIEIVTVTAIVVFYNGASLARYFGARANLFRASSESVEQFMLLTRRRLDAELLSARTAWQWLLALSALIVPWLAWMFIAHREAYLAHPMRLVIGFGGAPLVVLGLYVWARRKERKLRAAREAFERHVADARAV